VEEVLDLPLAPKVLNAHSAIITSAVHWVIFALLVSGVVCTVDVSAADARRPSDEYGGGSAAAGRKVRSFDDHGIRMDAKDYKSKSEYMR
jgi:hypothetical protein